MLAEIKRQFDEVIQTREINLSYLINNLQQAKRSSSPVKDQSLKFAMQIDKELFDLLGDENETNFNAG